MSRSAGIAALFVLFALGGCDSGTTHPNAEEEIVALERSALDKWSQGSAMGYAEIGAQDVTWFDFTAGEQQRVDGLEALRKYMESFEGQIPPHTYSIENPKVQVYGNAAILTFHYAGTTTDGTPMPKWKATSVYYWNDGQWRMVHAHWSLVQSE